MTIRHKQYMINNTGSTFSGGNRGVGGSAARRRRETEARQRNSRCALLTFIVMHSHLFVVIHSNSVDDGKQKLGKETLGTPPSFRESPIKSNS